MTDGRAESLLNCLNTRSFVRAVSGHVAAAERSCRDGAATSFAVSAPRISRERSQAVPRLGTDVTSHERTTRLAISKDDKSGM
ncbi:hypothetical protein EVAR_102514_1 [Eumeta japonica]|uniref:Uncharacterized protein n=1 Tax=Eumeta variegata TaxID=151549 RepID=A0A4C1SI68_EUMVA|nr:hypothetical protein EVAR_102514_1 [Eumeta japonica]